MSQHLSSEELEYALSGRILEASAWHVQECAECERELASMREALGNFRSSATAVAEHHRRFTAAAGRRRLPRMAWALAAAALFVSVGAPLAVRHHGGSVVTPTNSQAPVTMSDEALLNSVQDDLSSSVPDSMLPLAGTATNATSATDARSKN